MPNNNQDLIELAKKKGNGELIVIFQNGYSPMKQSDPRWRVLPKFYPRYNPVSFGKILVNGEEKASTDRLMDIQAVAMQNLEEKYSGIIAKKIAGVVVKEVIANPKNYGYQLRKKDLYPPIPTQEIKIDSSITDIALLAQSQNVSYKILKYFNPWLRKNYLSNKDKRTYILDLPKPGYNEEYIARLSSSDSLGNSSPSTQPATVPIAMPDSLK